MTSTNEMIDRKNHKIKKEEKQKQIRNTKLVP